MIARIEFDEAANWQDLAEAYKYLCTSPYPRFRSTGYTAWFLSNLHPNLRIPDRSKAAECDAAIAKTAAFFYPLER